MSTEMSPESESVTRNTLWKTWSQISADNTERERERETTARPRASFLNLNGVP